MKLYPIQILYDIFQIPFVYWNERERFCQPDEKSCQSPVMCDDALRTALEKLCDSSRFPMIYLEDELVFYGNFRGCEKQYFCLGPVSRITIGGMRVEEYKKLHHITVPFRIKQAGFGIITKLMALIFFQYTGEEIRYPDIRIKCNDSFIEEWESEENMEEYMLAQSEQEREHGKGMVFENHLMEIVKNGDVKAMKDAMSGSMPDIDGIGEVSFSNHRQAEYMIVVVLTLLTRAAMDGGMNPEDAYSLGDVYLRQIEKCSSDTGALTMLGIKAQYEFTEKVKEAKEKKSQFLYIEKCKDYIAKNLRKNVKVSDIAPKIGISRTYLTHKFSEVEGMTIQQYIIKERCEHAANLLKYSDYPVALISEYFCFSSQSHFGSCFKRIYGMTPKEYRIMYGRV